MQKSLKESEATFHTSSADLLIPRDFESVRTLNPEKSFTSSYRTISKINGGEKPIFNEAINFEPRELLSFCKKTLGANKLHHGTTTRGSTYYKVEGGEYDQYLIRCEFRNRKKSLKIYTAGKDQRLSGTYMICH